LRFINLTKEKNSKIEKAIKGENRCQAKLMREPLKRLVTVNKNIVKYM